MNRIDEFQLLDPLGDLLNEESFLCLTDEKLAELVKNTLNSLEELEPWWSSNQVRVTALGQLRGLVERILTEAQKHFEHGYRGTELTARIQSICDQAFQQRESFVKKMTTRRIEAELYEPTTTRVTQAMQMSFAPVNYVANNLDDCVQRIGIGTNWVHLDREPFLKNPAAEELFLKLYRYLDVGIRQSDLTPNQRNARRIANNVCDTANEWVRVGISHYELMTRLQPLVLEAIRENDHYLEEQERAKNPSKQESVGERADRILSTKTIR
jgi:hypothetical protein